MSWTREDERQETLYKFVKEQLKIRGSAFFRERPSEEGDTNKPVVNRLIEEGYPVAFDPGLDNAEGGFWRVSPKVTSKLTYRQKVASWFKA